MASINAGKKKIVILGAGFGGLRVALQLSKKLRRSGHDKNVEILLIDRNAYHTYTPTLYEAATTSKETANYCELKEIVTFSIPEIVTRYGIRFHQAETQKLDLIGGDIHLTDGSKIKFDHLALAPGSETNYFGIPGLEQHALPLKTLMNAFSIRDRILASVESGANPLRVIIGGGGSTGVELAGEIASWVEELAEKHRTNHEITVVEAAPSVLFGFGPSIIRKATSRLNDLGIKVLTNATITKVESDKVLLKDGAVLKSDVTIWTGGVKASSLIATLPLKLEQRGRVEVADAMFCLPQTPDLKLSGTIYGLGDAVCCYDPKTGKPMPGVARAAIAQADVVAANIWREISGHGAVRRYRPMNYPYVIPIGGKWAIAKLGPIKIWGFPGWILKGLVEINYLISIMPFWKAVKIWLKGLSIFIKNDRLG